MKSAFGLLLFSSLFSAPTNKLDINSPDTNQAMTPTINVYSRNLPCKEDEVIVRKAVGPAVDGFECVKIEIFCSQKENSGNKQCQPKQDIVLHPILPCRSFVPDSPLGGIDCTNLKLLISLLGKQKFFTLQNQRLLDACPDISVRKDLLEIY